ncbi:MAG: IS1595 family transposase [Chloroflexi bacterium]|nr:IS1595 family transposase [Chloroflexota bacterium]
MTTPRVTFQEVLKWSDEECRSYLEKMRWPDGPKCPKCGVTEHYRLTRHSQTKNAVTTLYRCKACKRQYTATVGTIFEDSHIPLSKWFAAIYLMCASKKGMSAHQIHRQLHIAYKSAWFMCHRIREAMKDKALPILAGTVEADETYIYPKRKRGHPIYHEQVKDEKQMGLRPKNHKDWREGKTTVFGMLERGGSVRTMVVPKATARELRPLLMGYIDQGNARLMTDGHPAYRLIHHKLPHGIIDHEISYVDGDIHTQGIDNYWSLLKRGLVGTFHHVDQQYLPEYLSEFEFRFNRRKISDETRFAALMGQTRGRVTWFCEKPLAENPHA